MIRNALIAAQVALASACVDSPTVDPPDAEEMLWPGYCEAANEQDGMEGADGLRVAEYDGDLLVRDTFDSDVDGDVDVITTYGYDEQDRLVRMEIDRFADDTIDEIREYEWSDDGRLTRETWDQDVDGTVDVDIAFEHDDQGRRVRGEGQADDDPEPEIVFRFEWDGDLLVAVYIDGFAGPADGFFERTIFYAYDELGNLTTAVFDFDANGIGDMIVTYSYDCWM